MTKWNKEWQSYFNQDGWWILSKIPFGSEMNPKLKPKEWLYWVLIHTKNVPENVWKNLIGSYVTIWRIKKQLQKKGYD